MRQGDAVKAALAWLLSSITYEAYAQDPSGSLKVKKGLTQGVSETGDDFGTGFLNGLIPGKFSMGVLFPYGGAVNGSPAMGIKYMAKKNVAFETLIQMGFDKANKKSAFGLTMRGFYYVDPDARATAYIVGDGAVGSNSGEGNRNKPEFQAGMSLGLGVEYFLYSELSTAAETGFAIRFLPTDELLVSTGTGQLRLNYYFHL